MTCEIELCVAAVFATKHGMCRCCAALVSYTRYRRNDVEPERNENQKANSEI